MKNAAAAPHVRMTDRMPRDVRHLADRARRPKDNASQGLLLRGVSVFESSEDRSRRYFFTSLSSGNSNVLGPAFTSTTMGEVSIVRNGVGIPPVAAALGLAAAPPDIIRAL